MHAGGEDHYCYLAPCHAAQSVNVHNVSHIDVQVADASTREAGTPPRRHSRGR